MWMLKEGWGLLLGPTTEPACRLTGTRSYIVAAFIAGASR